MARALASGQARFFGVERELARQHSWRLGYHTLPLTPSGKPRMILNLLAVANAIFSAAVRRAEAAV